MGSRGRGLRGQVEEREGGDAGTSATTSDKEMHRNPLPPKGLRRHRIIYGVSAPRQCPDITCVAAPVTRPHLLLGQTPMARALTADRIDTIMNGFSWSGELELLLPRIFIYQNGHSRQHARADRDRAGRSPVQHCPRIFHQHHRLHHLRSFRDYLCRASDDRAHPLPWSRQSW